MTGLRFIFLQGLSSDKGLFYWVRLSGRKS